MKQFLPLVFNSSYDDENLLHRVENIIKQSPYNNDYHNLHTTIINAFDAYIDEFSFRHLVSCTNFTLHLEFVNLKGDSTKQFIEKLAKQYGCNYVDTHCKATVCISTRQNVSVTFPEIRGSYHIDNKKQVSNCMFFIIIPVS